MSSTNTQPGGKKNHRKGLNFFRHRGRKYTVRNRYLGRRKPEVFWRKT